MRNHAGLCVAFGLFAAACGGGGETLDDAGGLPDAFMGDGGTMMGDAGSDDGTFAGARPVTTDGETVMGAIERPMDRDFWRFEGTAGDWVAINTTANPDDDPEMIDTVIVLYDATQTQIAVNDDSIPRASTDSEIVIRLPTTGTYYVEVMEFSDSEIYDPEDMLPSEGMASYTYELGVITLADGGAINIDGEAGDDVASAQALRFGGMSGNVAFVLGAMNDATDVDVFAFTTSSATRQILSTDVMPAGTSGYGSTRAAGGIWITDATGATIIARIRPRDGMQADITPSLPSGSYLLWVDAGGGTAGANDHYVLKGFLGTENPLEAETAGASSNDTTATAEAVTLEDQMGVMTGFILAELTETTDVDVFSFDVPAGREVSVGCGSASSGSGVMGMSIQLLGPDGTTMLGMDPEDPMTGAGIGPVAITTAGTHYLRIAKTGQSSEVTSTFVRCGIRHAAPAAP